MTVSPIPTARKAERHAQSVEPRRLAPELVDWWQRIAAVEPLELPATHRRPSLVGRHFASLTARLPTSFRQDLEAFLGPTPTILHSTFLAAFGVLLRRYCGRRQFVIATPVSRATHGTVGRRPGHFDNVLPMFIDVSGHPSVRALIQRVEDELRFAVTYQQALELVLHETPSLCDPNRPGSRVLFAFAEEMAARPVPSGQRDYGPFDVGLVVSDDGQGLHLELSFDTGSFDTALMSRMLKHLVSILTKFPVQADQSISKLELLSQQEQDCLVNEWGTAVGAYRRKVSVVTQFNEQAAGAPDRIATIAGAEHVTYGELDRRSNQLARYLIREGVRLETPVVLLMGNSPNTLVGIFGVLKAGGVYVPLDPAYPSERLRMVLDDIRAPLVLTEKRFASALPDHQRQVLLLDEDWEARVAPHSAAALAAETPPQSLAYLIYTSGSTGKPKGVMVEHESLTNYVQTVVDRYDLRPGRGWIVHGSLGFDSSVSKIFPSLCVGATLILDNETSEPYVERLRALASYHHVTGVGLSPILVAEFNREPERLGTLKTISSGGEALTAAHLNRLLEHVRILNLYGPAEATAAATGHTVGQADCDLAGSLPIGKPLPNYRVYVFDDEFHLSPVGCEGELFIGGLGVARGYFEQPGLTAERFLPDAYGVGVRLYRTGDVVRWLDHAVLQFVGREDRQVQVGGVRVELGDVEARLASHPDLAQVAVTPRATPAGGLQLIAYVVPQLEAPTQEELHGFLKSRMPTAMLPAAYIVLAQMPMTLHGKIDYRALPVPGQDEQEPDARSDQDPVLRVVAHVCAELLAVDRMGADENFFLLGGHSLLATRVISHLRRLFGIELTLATLFQTPTVRGLAAALRSEEPQPGLSAATAEILLEFVAEDRCG